MCKKYTRINMNHKQVVCYLNIEYFPISHNVLYVIGPVIIYIIRKLFSFAHRNRANVKSKSMTNIQTMCAEKQTKPRFDPSIL